MSKSKSNFSIQLQAAIQTGNLAQFLRDNVENRKLSVRGTASLCGIAHKNLAGGGTLKNQKLAEKLAVHGFEGGTLTKNGFCGKAAWLCVEYYAYESERGKTEIALAIARTFGSFGFQKAFEEASEGVSRPGDFTKEQIRAAFLQMNPAPHEVRFLREYYDQLSRLTDLPWDGGAAKPTFWAALTEELVYGYLPGDLTPEIRRIRDEYGCQFDCLHQYLSGDGLNVFQRHMDTLLILMRGSETLLTLRNALDRSYGNVIQGDFFTQTKKQGALAVRDQLRIKFGCDTVTER